MNWLTSVIARSGRVTGGDALRGTEHREVQKSPTNHESSVSSRRSVHESAAPYASLSVDLIGPQPRGVCLDENSGNANAVVAPVVATDPRTATSGPHYDSDLECVMTAWSELPVALRVGIMAMVKAAREEA